jgi:hypothetical protein
MSNNDSIKDEEVDIDTDKQELLCLSESPIFFDPLNDTTSVFFDKENQQIFCVRSNGVGGL